MRPPQVYEAAPRYAHFLGGTAHLLLMAEDRQVSKKMASASHRTGEGCDREKKHGGSPPFRLTYTSRDSGQHARSLGRGRSQTRRDGRESREAVPRQLLACRAGLFWHDAKPGDQLTVHFAVSERRAVHPRRPADGGAERTSLRGVEGAANAGRGCGNSIASVSASRRATANERGEDQNMHARTGPVPAVRGHRPGVAQRVGVDSFSLRQTEIQHEPQLFLELLRFQEMLLWIAKIVQQALGADKTLDSIVIPTNDLRHIAGYSQTWNY